MSRVVSTKVTLTTGKKVKVYYITGGFYEELRYFLDQDKPCVYSRLNELEESLLRIPDHILDRLRLLENLLESKIYEKLFLEMKEILEKKDPSKSFRKDDITNSMKTPFYWVLKATVFENLLKAGLITARGKRGWFRIGSNEMSEKV